MKKSDHSELKKTEREATPTVTGLSVEKEREILEKYHKKDKAYKEIQQNIVEFFLNQKGYKAEDVSIGLIDDEHAGANLHFVLDIQKDQFQKKFHIKSVMYQNSSFGTKYSELLAYIILEEYGCGPKEISTIIDFPQGFDIYQQVSGSGANLMIITEDLSNPDLHNPNKTSHFRTKKEAALTGLQSEIALYVSAPNDMEENIQRCFIRTISELLRLRDIIDNPGNIGLQHVREEDETIIMKPYIIDFAINPYPTKPENIAQYFWDDIITNRFSSKTFQFSQSCFTFNPDNDVRIGTLERIFGQDGNKAMEIIDKAIQTMINRFGEHLQEGENVEFLDRYSEDIKSRFADFQTLCANKLQLLQTELVPEQTQESAQPQQLREKPSGSPTSTMMSSTLTSAQGKAMN